MENCKRKIYVHEVKKGTRMQARDRQTKRQRGREEKEDFTILTNLQYREKIFKRKYRYTI